MVRYATLSNVVSKRAAFLTIGQSPRDDIVDEMRPWWEHRCRLDVLQRGALDELGRDEIASLAPKRGEHRLVSRLRDGTEVALGADWVHRRIQDLVSELERERVDFLVLLCTGRFPDLRSRKLVLEAQAIVDHTAAAFGAAVGVLVPHEEQRSDVARDAELVSHASPYSGDRFEEAARELAGAGVIVLHCMGYTEAMRTRMAEATGKPVLLARRMVASAVAQVLE
jgi:protein AroM